MEMVLNLFWEFLNSAVGVTIIATAGMVLLNKLFAIKPEWKKYEGSIIQAIRWAEKATIPTGTANPHLWKFNVALQHVLKAYEDKENYKPTNGILQGLIGGIEITHARLEKENLL